MIQRSYTLNGLNREALHAQLAGALGVLYGGFGDRSTREGIVVTVNLSDGAAQTHVDQLNSLMAAYDPALLTPDQQARKQLEQKLAAARRDYKGAELDPADFAGESALIQALARKLAWLEQEMADLRGS